MHFCGVMGLLFTLAFVAALVLNMAPRLSEGVERFEVVSGDSGRMVP